jgi:cysteine desulfurase
MNQILAEIPYARINGHKSKRLPNNVNISFEFIEGESILLMLDFSGYSCSSGSACTSGSLDPSHVLLAIGLPHEIAHGSLRVTFGKDSRQEHVDNLVKDLKEIVKKLRDMSPLYSDFLKNGRN